MLELQLRATQSVSTYRVTALITKFTWTNFAVIDSNEALKTTQTHNHPLTPSQSVTLSQSVTVSQSVSHGHSLTATHSHTHRHPPTHYHPPTHCQALHTQRTNERTNERTRLATRDSQSISSISPIHIHHTSSFRRNSNSAPQ